MAERFLAILIAVLFLLLIWSDEFFVKLAMLFTSAIGCVSLIWLRRYLGRDGTLIFAFTFIFAIAITLFNFAK